MRFLLKVMPFCENVTDVIWELFSKVNIIAFTIQRTQYYKLISFEVKELNDVYRNGYEIQCGIRIKEGLFHEKPFFFIV